MDQIQRRYLLKNRHRSEIVADTLKPAEVTLYFTKAKECREIRYEHTADRYIRVETAGTAGESLQESRTISRKKFFKNMSHRVGEIITKKRYPLQQEQEAFIECYGDKLSGLCTLLLPDTAGADAIRKRLEPFILYDITEDPRFFDRYLAQYGNPQIERYNIYTVFKNIELHREKQPHKLLFAEMKSIDALRILLFQRLTEIRMQSAQITEQKRLSGSINKIYEALSDAIALIEIFSELFPYPSESKLVSNLKNVLTMLQPSRDLLFLDTELEKIERKTETPYIKKVKQSIGIKKRGEAEKMARYFRSRAFTIIMKQYELFLKEQRESKNRYEALLPAGALAEQKYLCLYRTLAQTAAFLDGCSDDTSYRKIERDLHRYLVLCRAFENIGPVRKEKKKIDSSRKLFKKVEKIYNVKKRRLLCQSIIERGSRHLTQHERAFLETQIMKLSEKERDFPKRFYPSLLKLTETSLHL